MVNLHKTTRALKIPAASFGKILNQFEAEEIYNARSIGVCAPGKEDRVFSAVERL